MRYLLTAAAALLIAATACQSMTGTAATPVTTPTTCHAGSQDGQPLPDPTCTPGATNPQVTQSDIATTICKRGWTTTVRPPVSYTDRLKRQQIGEYGYSDTRIGDYEEDHEIPLELGGNPTSVLNLWPQPGASPNAKDKVESTLNHAVCAGKVSLTAAQAAIAKDWVTAESVLGLK